MGVLNVKAVVAAFNQEKALVGAFSVITNFRMELFGALFLAVKMKISNDVAAQLAAAAADGNYTEQFTKLCFNDGNVY